MFSTGYPPQDIDLVFSTGYTACSPQDINCSPQDIFSARAVFHWIYFISCGEHPISCGGVQWTHILWRTFPPWRTAVENTHISCGRPGISCGEPPVDDISCGGYPVDDTYPSYILWSTYPVDDGHPQDIRMSSTGPYILWRTAVDDIMLLYRCSDLSRIFLMLSRYLYLIQSDRF